MSILHIYWIQHWQLPHRFVLMCLEPCLPFAEQANYVYPVAAKHKIFEQLGEAYVKLVDP